MENSKSLQALFNSRKSELVEKLKNFSLPRDAKQVEQAVVSYMNELFSDHGDFRQSLNQSEDYIMQSAMALLKAQQGIVQEFSSVKIPQNEHGLGLNDSKPTEKKEKQHLKKEQYPYAVGATVVGGAIGALGGAWGVFFGSIAGTAIALYCINNPELKEKINSRKNMGTPMGGEKTPGEKVVGKGMEKVSEKPAEEKINIDKFTGIVSNICEEIDNLIKTYRAQINRVVAKYESQGQPALEKDFALVLENIQTLVGYERAHTANEDKYLPKLQQRIEDLAEVLENYGLEVVDYTEDHKDWFETVESENATGVKGAQPAIVKQGVVVLKGKVFVAKK